MRVIVSGPRDYWDYDAVERAMMCAAACGFAPSVILTGGASGVDTFAQGWADAHAIPREDYPVHPEEWRSLGKSAGPRRNRDMAGRAEACIIVRPAGKWTPGTRDMYQTALRTGLHVFKLEVEPEVDDLVIHIGGEHE